MRIVKEGLSLTVHPLGSFEFDGVEYAVGTDLLLDHTAYFPAPDDSWLRS